MIFLPVDEAYALDYFSILEVKFRQSLIPQTDLEKVKLFLASQMPKLETILASSEYTKLYYANLSIFHLEDAAKKKEMPHSIIAQKNRLRYERKQKLQRRFFRSLPQLEIKNK